MYGRMCEDEEVVIERMSKERSLGMEGPTTIRSRKGLNAAPRL